MKPVKREGAAPADRKSCPLFNSQPLFVVQGRKEVADVTILIWTLTPKCIFEVPKWQRVLCSQIAVSMRFISLFAYEFFVTLHCPLRNIRIFYPDKEGKLPLFRIFLGTMADRARRTRSVWSIADKIDCSRYTGRWLFKIAGFVKHNANINELHT